MFEIKIGYFWQVVRDAKVVNSGHDQYTASFPKPWLGTVEPPPPQVRYQGREAVATGWIEWPQVPGGMVTVSFRLS